MQYAALDTRIRLIRNERNLGLVGNWNRCIESARAPWIKFVFQDDLLDPDCLKNLLDRAGEQNRFVACHRRFIFEDGTTERTRLFYLRHRELLDSLYDGRSALSAMEFAQVASKRIGANLVGEPTTTLLHRSLFEQFGPFNDALVMSCDLEFWLRVGIHVGIAFVDDELATFRVHSRATSATNRRERRYRMDVLDDLVIWHNIVHLPVYEPLREVMRRSPEYGDPRRRLDEKMHIARAIAEEMDAIAGQNSSGARDQWQDFVRRFPRTHVGGPRHWLWRMSNGRRALLAQALTMAGAEE